MRHLFATFILAASIAAPAYAQSNVSFDRAHRSAAIEELAQTINDEYFDEDRANEIAAALRGAHGSGAFDDAATPDEWASALSEFLRNEDRHFSISYVGTELPQHHPSGGGNGSALDEAARANYGFEEVAILSGNIGYIRFDGFADAANEGAAQAATAALRFVANTDAVVFDVRENGGGAPSMVQFLISHFLDPREDTVINTFVSRDTPYPKELRALAHLPAGARPDVPLYVLISGRTGSAAEAFAYHLQAMERATILGETSYGAGNPGDLFRVSSGYTIFVSTGSARNPITGTNWEGVGVAPDVPVVANAALDQALALAYARLAEQTDNEMLRESWSWAAELVEARLNPLAISDAEMAEFAGTYGPRRLFVEDGMLLYQRGDSPVLHPIKLSEGRYSFEELPDYRLTFQRDNAGNIVSLTLNILGAPPSVSPRD